MIDVPRDEVPAFLGGALPIARSSDLAIGLGPVFVYRKVLVLRFEATILPNSKAQRIFLGPPPRRLALPFMNLRCAVRDESHSDRTVETHPVPRLSERGGRRCTDYFSVDDFGDTGTLSILWSYTEYGIEETKYDIDLEEVSTFRSKVNLIFAGGK